MMSSKDMLYDRYGLALLELFINIVIRSTNVHIMSVISGAHERREAMRRSVKLPLYLYSNHCRNTVSRIIPYKEIHLLSISTAKYVTEQ